MTMKQFDDALAELAKKIVGTDADRAERIARMNKNYETSLKVLNDEDVEQWSADITAFVDKCMGQGSDIGSAYAAMFSLMFGHMAVRTYSGIPASAILIYETAIRNVAQYALSGALQDARKMFNEKAASVQSDSATSGSAN